MGLGERIREKRKRLNLTQEKIAAHLNVTVQAVSQWERNKDTPTVSNLTALASFLHCTIDELNHKPIRHLKVINSFDPDEAEEDDNLEDGPSVSSAAGRKGISPGAVPEFNLRAGASYGGGYALMSEARKNGHSYAAESVQAEWTFPDRWLHGEMRLSIQTTDVLPVDGPSMSPDLEAGDRVLIDRSNRDPKQDAIFAIRDGESIIIKHVQLLRGSDPPRIVCRSSNPKYEPFELVLDGGQTDIIGRVAGRISKL